MNGTRGVRRPAVAGHFYPGRPDTLRDLVVGLLEGVPHEEQHCCGAVVPHAGLQYSGGCAAAVLGRVHIPDTVVILAPNHTGMGRSPGASLWARGAFRTPLGELWVNEAFAARLAADCELVSDDPRAHAEEHAVEVVLPFLQVRSPDVHIVPIVLSFGDWHRCEVLGQALAETVRDGPEEVLLLASSDMTHFEPAAHAERKDLMALRAIERLDGRTLLDVCRDENITMCGREPVACVLEAARALGATAGKLVDYRHSGWVTGDDSSVVAYAGVVLC